MKTKKCFFIIIGVVLGIFLMGTISYVVAETLINSKDVVYEDNSNLMADNVQDAIDGTCSKIDTRLSTIEDKLYTVKSMYVTKNITPPTDISYTGLSVIVPANSYCSLSGFAGWHMYQPLRVSLNSDSTHSNSTYSFIEYSGNHSQSSSMSTTYSFYTGGGTTTIYLWVKYVSNPSSQEEQVGIAGFCATKYK